MAFYLLAFLLLSFLTPETLHKVIFYKIAKAGSGSAVKKAAES